MVYSPFTVKVDSIADEYKVLVVALREDPEQLELRLNDAAEDRWQLHTVLQRGDSLVAVMRRERHHDGVT